MFVKPLFNAIIITRSSHADEYNMFVAIITDVKRVRFNEINNFIYGGIAMYLSIGAQYVRTITKKYNAVTSVSHQFLTDEGEVLVCKDKNSVFDYSQAELLDNCMLDVSPFAYIDSSGHASISWSLNNISILKEK